MAKPTIRKPKSKAKSIPDKKSPALDPAVETAAQELLDLLEAVKDGGSTLLSPDEEKVKLLSDRIRTFDFKSEFHHLPSNHIQLFTYDALKRKIEVSLSDGLVFDNLSVTSMDDIPRNIDADTCAWLKHCFRVTGILQELHEDMIIDLDQWYLRVMHARVKIASVKGLTLNLGKAQSLPSKL